MGCGAWEEGGVLHSAIRVFVSWLPHLHEEELVIKEVTCV